MSESYSLPYLHQYQKATPIPYIEYWRTDWNKTAMNKIDGIIANRQPARVVLPGYPVVTHEPPAPMPDAPKHEAWVLLFGLIAIAGISRIVYMLRGK